MLNTVYADNAATTKTDEFVLGEMLPWLSDGFGNASQLYSFARQPRHAIAKAREIIASCIGACPDEIYFTSGGTESDNWAIIGSAFSDSEHRLTITSSFEHHAILRACESIERLNYPIAYLSPTPDGYIRTEDLERIITDNTRLVSIMMVNNEIGTIQPVKELCEIAHSHGALFHTDAVQALGHIEVDVKKLGVDMLSASAHKFNGPKGVGFLYIRKGTNIVSLINGGKQEMGRRAGTENVAGIVGMAAALKHNVENLQHNKERIMSLERMLVSGLRNNGVAFSRNGGDRCLPGLLSLSFEGKDGESILNRMDLMGISISTGSACDSKNTEISHVLKAIGLDKSKALGTIRISLGKNNSESDIEKIIFALEKIIGKASYSNHDENGIKKTRKEYWEFALPAMINAVPELFLGKKETDRSAIDAKAPKGGHLYLSCIATAKKTIVAIYIRTGKKATAKAIFDLLRLRKAEIEAAVSTRNVEWIWTENDLDANIRCLIDISILDKRNWEKCRQFHCDTSKELFELLF